MAKASDLFAAGVSDHGALTGLGDDDHPQYLNTVRGDARYYTQAQVDTALGGKAAASHVHNLAALGDVTITSIVAGELVVWDGTNFINRTLSEAGIAAAAHSHAWADITGKPSTFAPSAHSHAIADITNLQTTLDGKAATAHGHAIADITNLQATLDGKAATSHAHNLAALADVTITAIASGEVLKWDGAKFINQTLAEAGIAAAGHGHTKADIGLGNVDNTSDLTKPISTATQSALDGKAPTSHSHTVANVTGLQAALDGKSATGHAHGWNEITGKPTSFAPSAHGHPISDVTGLQAALDAKAPLNRVVVSAAHTAQPEQTIGVDTTAGAITITAPAAPAANTYFYVADVGASAETNIITIDFGAATYNGNAGEDFQININEFGTGFLFTGGTWRLFR